MSRDVDFRTADSYARFKFGAGDLPAGLLNSNAGNLLGRALELAQTILSSQGIAKGPPIQLVADPGVVSDADGGHSVHLRQVLQGLPVFGSEQVVGFAADGTIDSTQARIAAPAQQPEFNPQVTAEAAAEAVAKFLLDGAQGGTRPQASLNLVEIASFHELPEKPVVFDAGVFGEAIRASLLWFPVGASLRLAWQIYVTMPGFGEAYRTIVSADDGTIMYSVQLISALTCTASVYAVDPDTPRVTLELPRPWSDYDTETSADVAAPASWCMADRTDGYCAQAFDADSHLPTAGQVSNDAVTFAPQDPLGSEQQIVNAFFACCAMHDFMALVGFGPADGGYQTGGNFGGMASKPVRVAVSAAPVLNVANWWNGTIRLGPYPPTARHAALDRTVVAHEYTHGISNRLVGGGLTSNPLVEPQSGGMSEGWSDYMACVATGRRIIGGWLSGDSQKGLRSFAYGPDFPVDKANFGLVPQMQRYQIGELWCAFLLEVADKIGRRLATSLVVDGMKGLMTNPSLLDARDNLLLKLDRRLTAGALTADIHAATKSAIWTVAARFGMGPAARTAGSGIDGIVADYSVPA